MPKSNIVGEWMRERRINKKLKLREVGADLDMDRALIAKYETGNRSITYKVVLIFSKYYNKNLSDLEGMWIMDKLKDVMEDTNWFIRDLSFDTKESRDTYGKDK